MGRRWLFGFFLVSGFCSLVLEVVWLRLAMARFGVTTALASIVLSVFMGGLALGSWGAGRVAQTVARRPPAVALRLYAAAETVIAVGAMSVPWLLDQGRAVLRASPGTGWGSGAYHAAAGLLVAMALLPFCACMGATFPLAVSVLGRGVGEGARSFSYLYVANVVGATAGTLLSAFVLIELLGFRGTLSVVAFFNASLGVTALALSLAAQLSEASEAAADEGPGGAPAPISARSAGTATLSVLFLTGLASMAMELVWVRQLTPYLGNMVYTFSVILGAYLTATFLGSVLYRRWSARRTEGALPTLSPALWALVGAAAMLPLVTCDPRVPVPPGFGGGTVRAALGIMPFCGALGFVTPLLMDRRSGGDPRRVGSAYALNVLGCILGPLLAGFSLLPSLGEKGSLAALAIPLLGVGAMGAATAGERAHRRRGAISILAATGLVVVAVSTTRSLEDLIPGVVVRRDSTATVAAFGEGMDRHLMVNGVGMTLLSPITKMMAHLPLAFRDERARSALIICFGMGTSYRSSLSWGVRTTAVELVPSVPPLFGFFHGDADAVLASPLGRIVVDDGRRFLERSPEVYDVMVVDPPPPTWAAGSSLLYSREFCETMRRRLSPKGIVQQWIPGGEPLVVASLVKALGDTFPHVRAFRSVEGWGLHLLASSQPIPPTSAETLAARLPARAVADLLEWGPKSAAADQFEAVLSQEMRPGDIVPPGVLALSDDRPLNEYYFVRQALALRGVSGVP